MCVFLNYTKKSCDLKFFLSLFTNYLEIDRKKNSNDELIDLYIDEENKINMAYIIYKSDPIRSD